MKWSLSITMESSLAGVRKLAAVVDAALAEEVSLQVRSEVELALVEACTNAVKYGFSTPSRGLTFGLQVELGEEEVRIVVENQGEPIDFPGVNALQFEPAKLETLPTRGMGLALIRALMNDVSFKAHQGLNRLVMVKHLQTAAGSGTRAGVNP